MTKFTKIALPIALAMGFAIVATQAADQFFAGDGSALSTAKWGPDGGPFTNSFVTGNVANFNIVNGTGTGGTISVGGIHVLQNFTITSASGTLGGTASTVNPITIDSGMTGDFAGQGWSTGATVGFSLNGGGVFGTSGGSFAGGFVLNSGTLVARGVNAMGAASTLTINGGTIAGSATRDFTGKYTSGITVGGNFQLGALSTAVAISSSTANLTFSNTMNLGASTRAITIGGNGTYTLGGVISGGVGTGLTVNALAGTTGILSLTNTNTYSGGTLINAGTLIVTQTGGLGAGNVSLTGGTAKLTLSGVSQDYISDSANLSIVNGNVVNLNFSGTDVVNSLFVDGVAQAPGLYGSGGSNPDGAFTGTGFIQVIAVPEPSVYMLLGVGILLCGQRFLRRKRA